MPLQTRCLGRATAAFVLAALVGTACGSSNKPSSTGGTTAAAAGTNSTALAHVFALDLPRMPLLGATSGLAQALRQGLKYRAGVLVMTDTLREELGRQGLWTSRTF